MSYSVISAKHPTDHDYPARTNTLRVRRSVLDRTFYEVLPYEFAKEKDDTGKMIPLRDRKPSVQYPLANVLVEHSASMLFGESRFPGVRSDVEGLTDALDAVIVEAQIQTMMMEAVERGSVGSACLLLKVLPVPGKGAGRFWVDVLDTEYLRPVFNRNAPDELERLEERYKVKGEELLSMGYQVEPGQMYWFRREWDANSETYYLPAALASGAEIAWVVDTERSTQHNLGFVPAVWIKNLPGKGIDGECSFERAMSLIVEMDYQLSQLGRGLKYSQDPTLVAKGVNMEQHELNKGFGALLLDSDGDAKLLEIDGGASKAVLEYVDTLRKYAMEVLHGNRANPDKMSAAQSGRAIEMLNQALIWLCGRLRVSYGENGMRRLLHMMMRAAAKVPVVVKGTRFPRFADDAWFELTWGRWVEPTENELHMTVQAVVEAVDARLMTRLDGIRIIAALFDMGPEDAELKLKEVLAEGLPDTEGPPRKDFAVEVLDDGETE